MERYAALGIMSGSSLDGIDLAFCIFWLENDQWKFQIEKAITYPYHEEWKLKLHTLHLKTQKEIEDTHIEYGRLISEKVNLFIKNYGIKPSLIASHGHTILHEPEKGYTLQIGDGRTIAKHTGITTINDFRSKDIELGGQGAPLVPIGDELLFGEYDFCINLGGIANISYKERGKRIAFDICPANQLLNHLSQQLGVPFDKNGAFAQLGKLNKTLFNKLNKDPYFSLLAPKSLSNQYVQNYFIKRLDESNASVEDKLYTVVKHIAFHLNEAVMTQPGSTTLITGGGAHNRFLINAISMETNMEIIIPDNQIIDFKEALIFAFMGILKNMGKVNCFSSVTGASKDCSSGEIYYP